MVMGVFYAQWTSFSGDFFFGIDTPGVADGAMDYGVTGLWGGSVRVGGAHFGADRDLPTTNGYGPFQRVVLFPVVFRPAHGGGRDHYVGFRA